MAGPGSPGLWRNRNYLRYRTARLISEFGSQLSVIAFPLLILHQGGNAVQAGSVVSCSLLTQTLCRLPGGHVADLLNRRLLMIFMDVVRLVAMGSVPLAVACGFLTYPQMLFVAVVEGAATATYWPAATGMLRELVPAAGLDRALGQAQGFGAVTALLGPTVGGLCYGLDPVFPFAVDAASYGLSAVLLLGVSVQVPAKAAAIDRRVTAGIRWLWSKPGILRILVFASIHNLVSAAAGVVALVVLREHGVPPATIGIVMACSGGGAVAGSFLARPIMRWLSAPLLCLVIAAVWAAGFLAFSAAFSPWVVGPVFALMFFFSPASGITLGRITLEQAPRELIGRIRSAEQVVSGSLFGVGPILGGLSLAALGASLVWVMLASFFLFVTVIVVMPLLVFSRGSADEATPVPHGADAALQKR